MAGYFFKAGNNFINPEILKYSLHQSGSSSGFQFGNVANLIGSLGSVLARDFQTTYEDSALDMSGSELTRKAISQSNRQTKQAIGLVSQVLMSVLSLVL